MLKLSIVTSFIASVIILFMGIFILVKDRRAQVNRYAAATLLFAFGILAGMFYIYAFPGSRFICYLYRISQISTAFLFASLVILVSVFPGKGEKFPFKYSILIYIPSIIISPFILFFDSNINKIHFKDNLLVIEYRLIYYFLLGIVAIYYLVIVLTILYKFYHTKNILHRKQIKFISIFGSIAIFIGITSSIILPLFFDFTELYVLGASLAFFIMAFSIFYSIIYLNLMDITTAIHKTTLYILLSAIIFIPIYIILLMYNTKSWFLDIIPFIPSYVIAGLIVILFILFSIYVQPVIDRFLRRKQIQFEKILDAFNRSLYSSKELNGIIKKTVDILSETLFLRHAFFIIYNKEKQIFESSYSSGASSVDYQIELNSSIIGWFFKKHEILDVERIYNDDKNSDEIIDDLSKIFDKNKIKIIMPVYKEGILFGLFCLGEKESLTSFNPDEITKLKYFNTEINDHIRRVLDYEEWGRDQFASGIIDLSSDIMSRAIPLKLPKVNELELGAFYIPKQREGIGYFDIIRPGSTGIGIIITEISGLGINKAIYSVVLKSVFHSCAPYAQSSFAIMQTLNNVIYEYCGGKEPYVNAYYLYYDILSMKLVYTNAGHAPLELYRIEKNIFETLDTEGSSLGLDLKTSYGMGKTNLLRNDIGIIYSKALITSKNKRGENFGLDTLHGIIKEFRHRHSSEITGIIKERFTSLMGLSPVESDIVIIVFKVI